jgi:hypothetical protein
MMSAKDLARMQQTNQTKTSRRNRHPRLTTRAPPSRGLRQSLSLLLNLLSWSTVAIMISFTLNLTHSCKSGVTKT